MVFYKINPIIFIFKLNYLLFIFNTKILTLKSMIFFVTLFNLFLSLLFIFDTILMKKEKNNNTYLIH